MHTIFHTIIKKSLTLITICLFFGISIIPSQTNAQEQAPAIAQRCTLTDQGYIDHCPQYRQQARTINIAAKKLFEIYETYTSKDAVISNINANISRMITQHQEAQATIITIPPQAQFMIDYSLWLFETYRTELQESKTIVGTATSLFDKSYFDKEQASLSLDHITLYKRPNTALVGDRSIESVQFTIRNYSQTETLSDIVDIYCFASLGQEDFIIPLGLPQQAFLPNTISHIIADIPIDHTRLTSFPGHRILSCQLIYNHNGSQHITNFADMAVMVE